MESVRDVEIDEMEPTRLAKHLVREDGAVKGAEPAACLDNAGQQSL